MYAHEAVEAPSGTSAWSVVAPGGRVDPVLYPEAICARGEAGQRGAEGDAAGRGPAEPRDAGAAAGEGQGQGLSLSVVVKDAARGIAAGVASVFPDAGSARLLSCALRKVRGRLERRAYTAIEREGEALGRKIRARDKTCRRKAKWALRKARLQCTEAIERFDAFEAAMDTVRGGLECVDVASGELHRPEQVEALIAQAANRRRRSYWRRPPSWWWRSRRPRRTM